VIGTVRRLLRRQTLERDLDAELRDHLEHEIRERLERGMTEADARRSARLTAGGIDQAKEACRDARGTAWIEETARDAAFALRQIRQAPVLWSAVILTLAAGVAASTVVFSIIDAVLLRPLPYPEADRLVSLGSLGYRGEFVELQRRSRTLDVGAYMNRPPATLTGYGEPERVSVALANAEFFSVLGSPARLGHAFEPADTAPGADAVVVLSYAWWQQRFAADSAIIGQPLTLDGRIYRVIGVASAQFRFPEGVSAWLPLIINPADRIDLWANGAVLVGRLRPEVTLAAAAEEVRSLVPTFRAFFPWKMPEDYGRSATVVPLRDRVVGDTESTLVVLFGSTLAVLALLCINVANLLLTRGLARARELAIRAALGATRRRLLRQLLAESLTVTIIAAALGVAISAAILPVIMRLLPPDVPRVHEITLDGSALAYALVVALITGIVFGTVPALSLAHTSSPSTRSPVLHPRDRHISRLLVATEFALAVMLIVSAGLVVGSVRQLMAVDVGFTPRRVVTATVAPPRLRYADSSAYRQFVDRVVARVGASQDVRGVAAATVAPFIGRQFGTVFSIFGEPDPATQSGTWPTADVVSAVSTDFFGVLNIGLEEGRLLEATDSETALPVAVIGRSLARAYWPKATPIGQRLRFPGPNQPWITVVGVVADIKWNNLGEERNWASGVPAESLKTMYVPLAQRARFDPAGVHLLVRTAGDTSAMAASLHAIVASIDRDAPVDDIRPMEDRIASSIARFRLVAGLLSGFALVALALAAFGVYCLLSISITRRKSELALRMALGANARRLLVQVVAEGASLALTGIMVGLLLATIGGRTLSALIFGIEPTDPGTLTIAAILLLAVGLLASLMAATQTLRVQPVQALQIE
jgi:putative ABC transport system permease protein